MEIRGVSREDLYLAAEKANVLLRGSGQWNSPDRFVTSKGLTRNGEPKWLVTLATVRDSAGGVVYGRRGFYVNKDGKRCRVPGAVCWHVHRAFMRALFSLRPNAVIISAFARYNGSEHFEQTHEETAYRNVGSSDEYGDLCDCGDDAPE